MSKFDFRRLMEIASRPAVFPAADRVRAKLQADKMVRCGEVSIKEMESVCREFRSDPAFISVVRFVLNQRRDNGEGAL